MGFRKEEATLIWELMNQAKELGFITIYGVSGSGKTTLARKVFEDVKICLEFPTRIWVDVSRTFNRRDVFLNILKRFTSDDMSGLSDPELAEAVSLCLEEEKFVLVIDGLSSSDNWDAIKDALPNSNVLGKVMITTHNFSIAPVCRGRSISLRPLSNEESWELLQLKVFGRVDDCSPDLVRIGYKLAQLCHGLPLAIGVIGGILVDLFIKQGPVPVLKTKFEMMSGINKDDFGSKLVEYSYSELSGYLKECFLYLAVFPEDRHTIPARMLIQLWIAEGFIPPKEEKMLEETAEEYLDELITRNLLMADRINPMGKIKTCRIHDTIREFAKEKALEENLFKEVKRSNERVEKFNRLCLHSDLNKFLSEKPKGPRVRSFLCFYEEPAHMDPKCVSTIADAFSLLRVFDSKCIKFTQLPAWITKLMHLRYITLNIDALTILPEPLSHLWNLHTLVVETKSRLITMKANIWRMYRMRHLKTKAAIVLDTKSEGEAGGNLQTVSRLSPESCTEDMFKRASNLKKLAIRGKLSTLSTNMFLKRLERLEKLELVNDLYHKTTYEDPLNGIPQPNTFPPNLKQLTLSNTLLKWRHMSILSEIETLEVLKLKDNAFTGIYWTAVDISFPKLHFLLIANTDLVHWEASTKSLPNLNCLVLKKCENLNKIPAVLAENLKKLEIESIGRSALDSARRISELKPDLRLSIGLQC